MARQNIIFFGKLADQFGRSIRFEMADDIATIAELRNALSNGDGRFAEIMADAAVRACVDGVIVTDDSLVHAGQEIAFIPPLSGG